MENKNFKKYNRHFCSIALFLALIILFIISLCIGNYKSLGVSDVFKILFGYNNYVGSTEYNIVFMIRMPRTLSAIVIGGCLAIAGLIYQETFDNELSSPDILGVSSGSCVGACVAILLGVSNIVLQIFSFIGGLIALILAFTLTIAFKKNRKVSLVLSGILISGLLQSILSLIKYLADPGSTLPTIIYWMMGSVSDITYEQLLIATIPCILCLIVLFILRWRINFFKINDTSARSTGVNIKILKVVSLFCATILIACCVSISGTIGWIGLAIPHLSRAIFGNNVKKNFIPTFLLGAIFLTLIDIINRCISTAELPLGILCGIVGIIIFVVCFIIRRKRYENVY